MPRITPRWSATVPEGAGIRSCDFSMHRESQSLRKVLDLPSPRSRPGSRANLWLLTPSNKLSRRQMYWCLLGGHAEGLGLSGAVSVDQSLVAGAVAFTAPRKEKHGVAGKESKWFRRKRINTALSCNYTLLPLLSTPFSPNTTSACLLLPPLPPLYRSM